MTSSSCSLQSRAAKAQRSGTRAASLRAPGADSARRAGAGRHPPRRPRRAGPRTYQREHFISVGVFGRAGASRLFQRLLPHVHGGQQGRCRLRVPGRVGGVAAAWVAAVPRRALPAAEPDLAAAPAPRAAVALHRVPGAPAPPPRRTFNRLRAGPAPPPRPPLASRPLAGRPPPSARTGGKATQRPGLFGFLSDFGHSACRLFWDLYVGVSLTSPKAFPSPRPGHLPNTCRNRPAWPRGAGWAGSAECGLQRA